MRSELAAALLAFAALAAPPAHAAEQSCLDEVGKATAETYVEQCLTVSPATHPPCNTANSCALIIDEIERGCAMIREAGEDVPEFCDQSLDEDNEEPQDEEPGDSQ